MRKTLITFGTVTVIAIGSMLLPEVTHANPSNLDEVKAERQEIKSKLSDKEKEIVEVLEEIEDLHKNIVEIEDALKANQEQMNDAEETIEQYETEIAEIQKEIDQLNDEIEKRNDILRSRIASYQENGGNLSFLNVLLGANDFNDFISRISAFNRIAEAESEIIEKQKQDQALVIEHQNEIKEKLEEQEEIMVELEGMKITIEEQKEEAEKAKKELDEKEKKLKEEKNKLSSKDSDLATLERSFRNRMTSYTPASSKPQVKSSSPPAISGSGNKSVAINAGFNHLGTPYRWAGRTPGGFDCSGFVSWAYGQAGYNLPSSTAGLSSVGTKVSYGSAQPGDLVFFNTYKTNGHVGIYLGNGKFIGSQNSTGLAVADMTKGYWKNHFTGHVRRIN